MKRQGLALLMSCVVLVTGIATCGPATSPESLQAPPPTAQSQPTEEKAAAALPAEAATVPVTGIEAPPTPTTAAGTAPTAELVADACNAAEAAWIGTFGFGLDCLDGAGWHLYSEDNAPIGDQISDVVVCPENRVWMAHTYGVSVTDGQAWETFHDDWGYGQPERVACDGAGGVWVAHYEGVSHYDGSQWTTYEAAQLGSGQNVKLVKDVAVGAGGTVWVATANSVASFDGAAWTVYETGKGFEQDQYFEALATDSEGRVWAAHLSGLWLFDGTNWVPHEGRHLSQAKSLAVDTQGRLWVGTASSGASVYDGQGWVTYDRENSGLSSNNVHALAVDAQGRIWLGTEWGLDVFDGQIWQVYHMHTSDLADNDVCALAVGGNGPALPELVEKPAGALSGKIVRGAEPVAGVALEACAEFIGPLFSGPSPCAGMALSAAAVTGEDGTFRFADLPAGRYGLAFQPDGENWARLTATFGVGDKKVAVLAGEETTLGEIDIGQ